MQLPIETRLRVHIAAKPSVVLAHLLRTPASLDEHGDNMAVDWSPDTSKIVIQVHILPRQVA